jgi:Sulfotransferase domain
MRVSHSALTLDVGERSGHRAATEVGRPRQPPSVLYVGGFSRSGSTLLAYLLGVVEGFWPVGELRELWTKGLVDDNLCSCGERFSACPFWSAVGERAFGGWDAVDVQDLAASSASLATDTRLVPALLTGLTSNRLIRFGGHTARVYRAVRELTGCSVIVDSSKVAPYALLMASDDRVRLRVIQLVRDSRAVAFSWAKRGVVKPDVEGHLATMDTYTTGATALRWSYHNALFSLFPLRQIRLARMRYEELVADPGGEIDRSLCKLGLTVDDAARSALASGNVSLAHGHTIGGNPMRFRGTQQPVRLDDEWRRAMPLGVHRRVTMATWPLLARYGYITGCRSQRR